MVYPKVKSTSGRDRKAGKSLYVALLLAGIVSVPIIAWVTSLFQSPKMDLLTRISRVQGWTQNDTKLWQRVREDALSNRNPTDADWSEVVQVANKYEVNYIETLVLDIPHHLRDERYQSVVRQWCRRLMNVPESKDPYAALLGVNGYLACNATDKDEWIAKIRRRGGMYPDQIDKAIARERSWAASHGGSKS